MWMVTANELEHYFPGAIIDIEDEVIVAQATAPEAREVLAPFDRT